MALIGQQTEHSSRRNICCHFDALPMILDQTVTSTSCSPENLHFKQPAIYGPVHEIRRLKGLMREEGAAVTNPIMRRASWRIRGGADATPDGCHVPDAIMRHQMAINKAHKAD